VTKRGFADGNGLFLGNDHDEVVGSSAEPRSEISDAY
jgi:hypothetical protein